MKKFTKNLLLVLTLAMCLSQIVIQGQAATLTVTKTADTNDGICNADCSLREAIAVAASGDTIQFSALFNSPQSIVLTQGRLLVDKSLTITGPGATLLSISGNNANRVFTFAGGNVTANLSDLTIVGGNAQGLDFAGRGGAILSEATLNLSNLKIINNSASNDGGGISNVNNGIVTITNSIIDNNLSSYSGSIDNSGFRMTITNSSISNNKATFGDGGGVYNRSQLIVMNCTISNNQASGNFLAGGSGGAISNYGTATIINSTITNNTATLGGGGVHRDSFAGSVLVRNTIIAANTASSSPDIFGSFISHGNNLIGNSSGSSGFTNNVNGDKVGSAAAPINPLLGALQNNGGFTQTRALLAGSPAIDAGNNCVVLPAANGGCLAVPLTTDQRGAGFPRLQGGAVDIGAFEVTVTVRARFDFDGDGKSDISVFRPSSGAWFELRSGSGFFAQQWGANGDLIAPADFDGDGRTDVAVFRPSSGVWYIFNSANSSVTSLQFGAAGDLPRPADFDGDNKADVCVFRPSSGTWFRFNSSNNQFVSTQFGATGDIPQPADFDGDGKADLNVFRPSTGGWYRLNSNGGSFFAVQFGAQGDLPVAADYDGDAKADVSVFRPSNGVWYRINSQSGQISQVQFGANGDQPAPADYDGDGRADVAVFRAGTWFLQQTTAGFASVPFGITGDTAIPSAFIQ